jgi:dynein light intermediate chain 2
LTGYRSGVGGKEGAGAGAGGKIISHIWEHGGGNNNIHEARLLEVPLAPQALAGPAGSAAVIVCVDLTRPYQLLASTNMWINNAREVINKRLIEIRNNNNKSTGPGQGPGMSQINNIVKSVAYVGHVDENKVNPSLEVPIYIFANKYDLWKATPQSDKRLCLQALRFLAHYHGATLLATSSVEPSMKESLRGVLAAINFRTPLKPCFDASLDRPFYISPGLDSFQAILLGLGQGAGDKDKEANAQIKVI